MCKEHGKAIPCYSYKWDPYHYGKNQEFKFTPWVIHHAGLFACTRWTNLYFPAKLGLFGDFVGGPLQTWFGPGIKDIQVRTGNIFRDLTLLAHNSYWHISKNKAKNKNCLQLLIDALDLDNKEILNF